MQSQDECTFCMQTHLNCPHGESTILPHAIILSCCVTFERTCSPPQFVISSWILLNGSAPVSEIIVSTIRPCIRNLNRIIYIGTFVHNWLNASLLDLLWFKLEINTCYKFLPRNKLSFAAFWEVQWRVDDLVNIYSATFLNC